MEGCGKAERNMSEDTRPLAGLPPADRTLLVRPPLELAVAEVRFAADQVDLSAEAGLVFHRRLLEAGVPFARMEPVQQNQITLNVQAGVAAAPQVQTEARGWQFHSSDGKTQATLLPGAVVFQTSTYRRWSHTMRPALEALYGLTKELLRPTLVQRIGLRYIDRFVDTRASSPSAWQGRITDTFLGPAVHPVLHDLVMGAQQQVELRLGVAQGARIRQGPFVDQAAEGSVSYLLDIDVYDAEPSVFDVDAVVVRAEVLNRSAASLFQTVLVPDYLRALQTEQADDDDDAAVGQ
jgi:uncharacterized protein (TIGR04255 family)